MSNNFYKNEYMPKINRIGKFTGYIGVLLACITKLFLRLVALMVLH